MVSEKEVVEAVMALNESGLVHEVSIVGVSFQSLKDSFLSAVELISDADIEKVPIVVGEINNLLIDEEDAAREIHKKIDEAGETPEEPEERSHEPKEKTVSKKKEKVIKEPKAKNGEPKVSKTSEVADLLKEGKSTDEICAYMTNKYGEKTGNKRNVTMYINNIKKVGK